MKWILHSIILIVGLVHLGQAHPLKAEVEVGPGNPVNEKGELLDEDGGYPTRGESETSPYDQSSPSSDYSPSPPESPKSYDDGSNSHYESSPSSSAYTNNNLPQVGSPYSIINVNGQPDIGSPYLSSNPYASINPYESSQSGVASPYEGTDLQQNTNAFISPSSPPDNTSPYENAPSDVSSPYGSGSPYQASGLSDSGSPYESSSPYDSNGPSESSSPYDSSGPSESSSPYGPSESVSNGPHEGSISSSSYDPSTSGGPYDSASPLDSENEIYSSHSEPQDDMAEIFRSLNLPEDFADGSKSTVSPPDDHSSSGSSAHSVSTLYMTGNPKLDRIMNCPCKHYQLEELGVQGYPYQSTSSSSNYGHIAEVYGTSSKLNEAGGATGSILGEVLKLVLSIPSTTLSVVQPLITGITGTAAHATDGAASLSAHVAKRLPTVASAKADVVKRLIETLGHSSGSVLETVSKLIQSAASRQMHFTSNILPSAFEALGQRSKQAASTVGTVTDGLAGTTKIIASGARDVAQAAGKLASSAAKGGHEFKAGVLDGLKNVAADLQQSQNYVQSHHQYGQSGISSLGLGYH